MSLNALYTIAPHAGRNYIRLAFLGHMDHATVDRFEQELASAFACMPTKGDCRFLSDIREAGIQSRDITERLQGIMAQYVTRHGPLTRGIAMLVSGSSLEMLQARRVAGAGGTAFFVSEDDALVWLFGETVGDMAQA